MVWGDAVMVQGEALKVVDEAIARYTGDVSVLEAAIGALMVGRRVGWRPLLLMHSSATIARYQEILGLKFREVLPEVGPLAGKSLGWKLLGDVRDFWKVVRRRLPGNSKELIALDVC